MIETTEGAISLKTELKKIFGYDEFRGAQEKIILNILAGKNTFVIMPTGAGKSLCYQLPAIVKEGTAIVISPLIALMKNQVDQMVSVGVNAKFLNSTLSKAEIVKVKKEITSGEVKLLYVAPESLTKEENIAFLRNANIAFVAIDEVHCISEWGHDFRPEYRRIKAIVSQIGDVPIMALTATATPKVQLDVMKNLNMEGANLFKSSFNRSNLYYEVKPKQQAKKLLIQFVKGHKGKSGIVYCLSRKKVEEIAQLLKVNGVNAAPYHAGMEPSQRIAHQDGFLNEDIEVIVATIAFGMGIDKPDVRFVVHYDVPKSIEGYYQETGRAGRDGLEGKCLLLYSYNDILKLEKFNKDKPVTERENSKLLLEEMASYAESSVCRRTQLLYYFGEEYKQDNCGMCDNCLHPKEQFEGAEYLKMVINAVKQTQERFEINHLVNFITGKKNQNIKSYGHDQLSGFGTGVEESEFFWKAVLRQALFNELLLKDIDNPGLFKVSTKGFDYLHKSYSIKISRDHEFVTTGEEEEIEKSVINIQAYDPTLFNLLKGLRKKVAKEKDLPPYVIFQEPSLEEMATVYPLTSDDLKKIIGVGESKARKFGQPFLNLINQYVDENDIITASDVLVKSAGVKSRNKISIINQIDKKQDLEEIASGLSISYEQLITEIEHICDGGTKLNLDYYLDDILDDERQEDIFDYFLTSESGDLQEAIKDFSGEYSEDEVRLMRIKFMSEYAH
jgi:ATP-dependent DNA helicase RecQ